MKEEYLSIAEFAKLAGISRQAIYKRIEGDLAKDIKIIEGKKLIRKSALQKVMTVQEMAEKTEKLSTKIDEKTNEVDSQKSKEIQGVQQNSVNQTVNQTVNQNQVDNLVDTMQRTVGLLERQLNLASSQNESLGAELAIKNRQIEDLSKRLQESHVLLDQQQKLHAITEKILDKAEQKEFEEEQAPKSDAEPETIEVAEIAEPETIDIGHVRVMSLKEKSEIYEENDKLMVGIARAKKEPEPELDKTPTVELGAPTFDEWNSIQKENRRLHKEYESALRNIIKEQQKDIDFYIQHEEVFKAKIDQLFEDREALERELDKIKRAAQATDQEQKKKKGLFGLFK